MQLEEDMGPGFGVSRSQPGMAQGLAEEDNHPAGTTADSGLGLAAVMMNACQ